VDAVVSRPVVRATRQRAAIAAVLDEVETFVTAQELHELLRARGEQVGLATVYRCLQTLADANKVDVLRTDGETAYRRCAQGHHHHLVCRSCRRTIEIDGPDVERWAGKVAAAHGFTDISHTLEVFGTCEPCASSGAARRDEPDNAP
jgi:Fur family ferric uptake transcriptional regulator